MKALSKSALHLSGSPHGLSESSRPAGAAPGCRLKYILAVSAYIFCFSQFIRIFYIGFCQVFFCGNNEKALFPLWGIYGILHPNFIVQRISMLHKQRN